jgi:hypothetical protein
MSVRRPGLGEGGRVLPAEEGLAASRHPCPCPTAGQAQHLLHLALTTHQGSSQLSRLRVPNSMALVMVLIVVVVLVVLIVVVVMVLVAIVVVVVLVVVVAVVVLVVVMVVVVMVLGCQSGGRGLGLRSCDLGLGRRKWWS